MEDAVRPADWTWPPATATFPIRLNKRQFRLAAIAEIVASLIVAVCVVVLFS